MVGHLCCLAQTAVVPTQVVFSQGVLSRTLHPRSLNHTVWGSVEEFCHVRVLEELYPTVPPEVHPWREVPPSSPSGMERTLQGS